MWFHCLLHFSSVNSEYGPFSRRFLRWRSFFCRAIVEVAWSVLKDIWGLFRVAEIQLQRYDLPLQPSWARVAPCYDHDFHVDWSWSEDASKWDDCQGSRLVVAHISRCWQCQVTSIQNVACSKLSQNFGTFSDSWDINNIYLKPHELLSKMTPLFKATNLRKHSNRFSKSKQSASGFRCILTRPIVN